MDRWVDRAVVVKEVMVLYDRFFFFFFFFLFFFFFFFFG